MNSGILRIIVFCLLVTVLNNFVRATEEWKVVCSFFESVDTIYNIKDEGHILYDNYFFPEKYYPLNKEIYTAVKPLSSKRKNSDTSILYYKKRFNTYHKFKLDNAMVNFRTYLSNINEYQIIIITTAGDTLKKQFDVTYEGYQDYNFFDCLKEWEGANKIKDSDNCSLKSLRIEALTTKTKYQFAIGELLIYIKKDIDLEVEHPFFSFIHNSNNKYSLKEEFESDNLFDSSRVTLLPSFNEFRNGVRGNQIRFVPDSNQNIASINEKELLETIYKEALNWYPFYDERNIDKEYILKEFNRIQNDTLIKSVKELAINLAQLTRKFNDGHFAIIVPKDMVSDGKKKKKVRSNIRLISLHDKYYISAVFDTTLQKNMLLGKEVIAIDGKNLIKDLRTPTLLDRPKGQNVIIHYLNAQNTIDSINICNNIIYSIPSNFKPKHCDFKLSNDGIAYFRINSFNQDVYLRFLNHYNKISNAKGLILDLRSNGGGVSTIGQRLLSLFINKPTVYSHLLHRMGDKESIVVLPHKRFYLTIPTVILIDKRTACASEEFADAMRHSARAILVGKSSTAGTYASLYELYFPSGVRLKINSLSPKMIVSTGKRIENIGISPNIWVKISDVQDLYPYQDKVNLIGRKILSD